MIMRDELAAAIQDELPFKIVLNNGREYVVRNAREIHMCDGVSYIVFVSNTPPMIPATISLMAISCLEGLPPVVEAPPK
jgi:hypothetical protein